MAKPHVVVWSVVLLLLAPALCATVGCTGEDEPITPVFDWFVGFAKATGEFVVEKASNFADAVARAWTAFWGPDKVNNVLVDEDNPLKGMYDGKLQCSVAWGAEGSDPRDNRLEIELDRPRMIRESADSEEWALAPKEKSRIKELQKLLLGTT